ncbi:hypothetical protein [Pedobacter psychroterrae]|uniref:Uncharacterized protein n=1 Tax=Pedobacter psychroterrae TaxID=2530453 RepID=A0A4R0NCK6_9SPHI|nr:hypothetical protein [Pedobacter psychroterrae]TCC97978.1 hypothetical protein EZ437_19205 [Pedobacter psychroterrae]
MIETSTSFNKLNYPQSKQENMPAEDLESCDLVFYDTIKSQLDSLSKNPSDETISKILAYSKAR